MAIRIPAPRTVTLRLTTVHSDSVIERIIREATAGANTTPVTLVKPRKPVPAGWRTVKQRKAGAGFACTHPTNPCSRRDLKTDKFSASHKLPNGHTPR